jgi:hypothetical protein
MLNRVLSIWRSYRCLPFWVQIWVGGILVPVNAAAFALNDTPSGYWAAWAAAFVVATNVPIMWVEQGMSKLMSLPHLVAWIPLQAFLLGRLLGYIDMTPLSKVEIIFATALAIVNGISIAFDVVDSVKWWRGDRQVTGRLA